MRRRKLRGLIALVLLAGCKKSEPATGTGSGSAKGAEAIARGPAPLASKDYFRVDAGPRTPCTAGAACEARLVLTALGDYHVNDKYPFKLVADAPSGGITVDGTGTFVLEDAKTGTLTVKYTAAKPGAAKLNGTFKLSVCTEENCQIESPKIALDVEAR